MMFCMPFKKNLDTAYLVFMIVLPFVYCANSAFEFINGNATNMALLRGWRLAMDDMCWAWRKENRFYNGIHQHPWWFLLCLALF